MKSPESVNALVGSFYSSGFDLEEMYPHANESPPYLLSEISLHERVDA